MSCGNDTDHASPLQNTFSVVDSEQMNSHCPFLVTGQVQVNFVTLVQVVHLQLLLLGFKTIPYNRPPHPSHSVVCMRPSLQGLTWFEYCEISKEELLIRFMSYV